MKSFVAAMAIAGVLTSGCATLMAPGPDLVPIATNPAGAQVFLNGQFVGNTPTLVPLARSQPAHIQIQLPGFQPVVMHREKRFNAWFIGSILLISLIVPVVVDIAAGNVTRYDNGGIAIGLTPLPGYAPGYPQQPPYAPQPPAGPPPPQ